jgi:hypothetical protein
VLSSSSVSDSDEVKMDFLTGMAYWGILLLVLINALWVSKMRVEIHREESENPPGVSSNPDFEH